MHWKGVLLCCLVLLPLHAEDKPNPAEPVLPSLVTFYRVKGKGGPGGFGARDAGNRFFVADRQQTLARLRSKRYVTYAISPGHHDFAIVETVRDDGSPGKARASLSLELRPGEHVFIKLWGIAHAFSLNYGMDRVACEQAVDEVKTMDAVNDSDIRLRVGIVDTGTYFRHECR